MSEIGVITADIRDSTKMASSALSMVMEELQARLDKLKMAKQISHYQMYRGDATQIIISNPEKALHIAYLIKTGINRLPVSKNTKRGMKIRYDMRMGIGIGMVETDQLTRITNEIPFVRSGRELDRISGSEAIIGISTGNKQADREFETELCLYHGITKKWTRAASEVIFHKLLNKTENEIAEDLSISQPAVNQHAKAAYWKGLKCLLERYVEVIKNLHS